MSIYRETGSFSIPCKLIDHYKSLHLNEKQLITLLRILSVSSSKMPLVELMKTTKITKEDLTSLSAKGLITVEAVDQQITIDIEPLFEELVRLDVSKSKVTIENLERIKSLLGRSMSTIELDKIKEWFDDGYTIEQVELAIKKSLLNEVDNFNYIDTVLANEAKKEESGKINRKDDLY